ncbi:MAG: phosphate ABC transporter substrate-binding protein [Deltaproteobacteria bacterium]|nr:phosphate ABC transporter substrate-binding protein [Deltaproteobacteria bacterium]
MQLRTRRLSLFTSLLLSVAAGACSGGHGRGDEPSAETTTEGASPTPQSTTLTIKGSDTMVILAQRWAEAFMAANPGTTLQVSGGGSGTGIAALINGTVDLADASRPMKDREKTQIRERRNGEAHEIPVALDALAVYVHDDNPVHSLTIPQLKQIFRGEVTNWNQVGGSDAAIVLYGRENNSGTYAYFKEHVLDDLDFAQEAQSLPGTAAVINAVSHDPGGVGYGGIAYAQGVHTVSVAAEGGQPIEPNMQNALDGSYPLSRFLYVYSVGQPSGLAQRYVEFMLSSAGQALVENVGYYPLPHEGAAEVPAPSGAAAPEAPAEPAQ